MLWKYRFYVLSDRLLCIYLRRKLFSLKFPIFRLTLDLRITADTPTKSDSKSHLNDLLADKSKRLVDSDVLNKDFDDSYDDQDNESGAENLSGIMGNVESFLFFK